METKEKRPRGRPRKNPLPPADLPKRPRGRPRKNPLPVVATQVEVKKPRGRPRKNVSAQIFAKAIATNPKSVVKDYCLLSSEDLEMWIESTGRSIFSDALSQYNKLVKAKVPAEIRWHVDRIDVVAK